MNTIVFGAIIPFAIGALIARVGILLGCPFWITILADTIAIIIYLHLMYKHNIF